MDQQNKVLEFAKPWSTAAKLEFERSTAFDAEIRVSFNQQLGNWSYIGTDSIHRNLGYHKASMNLADVDSATVLHEFGHALGLGHEHQHPDAQVTLDEQRIISDMTSHPYNWSLEQVERNILKRFTRAVVDTIPYDSLSIMAYPFPAAWLMAGSPIPRNTSLSSGDTKLVQDLYGKRAP
ncbi:M12 family metallopeptidase [Archangium violaceum]|uniref:M12 family metallopeptidase n=1 Tax=Archangium violaceum TaxID=83451 RepID=UPI001363E463|nr:M12 family metallopeptidase [Archangium violaceum]